VRNVRADTDPLAAADLYSAPVRADLLILMLCVAVGCSRQEEPPKAAGSEPVADAEAGRDVAPAGNVHGRLVDGLGNPLTGCTVVAECRGEWAADDAAAPAALRTVSDHDGRFAFDLPADVTFALSAFPAGLPPCLLWERLRCQQPRDLGTIAVRERPGLVVAVVDEHGHRLPAATVQLRPQLGEADLPAMARSTLQRRGTTGSDGTVQLRAPAPGACVVHVELAGWLASEVVWLSDAGLPATRPFEVVMSRGGELSGRLRRSTGEALAGVAVRCRPIAGGPFVETITAADGSFRCSGLQPTPQQLHVQWTPGGDVTLLPLSPTGDVGDLQLPSGKPFACSVTSGGAATGTAEIELVPQQPLAVGPALLRRIRLRSATDGAVRAEDIPTGRYVATVSSQGCFADERELDLPAPPMTLTLQPLPTLAGRIVDADGVPRQGVQIECVADDAFALPAAPSRRARTDGNGRFALPQVPAGRCRVRAQTSDAAPAVSEPIAIGKGQLPAAVQLRLGRAGWLVGTVRRAGVPVADVQVTARGQRPGAPIAMATSAADGAFRLGPLAADHYTVIYPSWTALAIAPKPTGAVGDAELPVRSIDLAEGQELRLELEWR
jgi:hypothetical protein